MDRKELETQVLNMVAMSYKQDIKDISVSTSFKEDLGLSLIHISEPTRPY